MIRWRLNADECTLMSVNQELLRILVCPLCKTPVEGTLDESGLRCIACKRVYPVRDNIPVMLVDEAKIDG
jgi:uncharacterized protein